MQEVDTVGEVRKTLEPGVAQRLRAIIFTFALETN